MSNFKARAHYLPRSQALSEQFPRHFSRFTKLSVAAIVAKAQFELEAIRAKGRSTSRRWAGRRMMRVCAFDDLELPGAGIGHGRSRLRSSVAAVGDDDLDERQQMTGSLQLQTIGRHR